MRVREIEGREFVPFSGDHAVVVDAFHNALKVRFERNPVANAQ